MWRFLFTPIILLTVTFFSVTNLVADEEEHDHTFRYEKVDPTPQPPDGREAFVPELNTKEISSSLVGPITPAANQPIGSLSGKIVYMSCGHGWTYGTSSGGQFWRLQRGTGQVMNEDYGNLDQLNLFAMYCFNAGATVVPYRAIGRQTNEVVVDNVSPGAKFAGTWNNTANTSYYYGVSGQTGYRFASLNASETATATYTPNIPVTGFYPVYTWVRHGSDRGLQLYRVRHTGGESQVRVPHYMVGNGWVFLGEYYFNAGSNAAVGSVVISNLRSSTNGGVVIADAIRFGNGMGSIDRGGGISTYPREEECTRYWAHAGIGVGMPSSLYDSGSHDESDSWSTPSKMSAEMNLGPSGSNLDYKRVHISFHSNAGGGRGVVGLITGDPTPNQARLAKICGDEVNADLVGLASVLEVPWANRTTTTYSGGYSEIDGSLYNYEMDATIIEVAFHDNSEDAKLMRDPKARNAIARASYHAVVKYMNEFDPDTNSRPPLIYLPEPPNNPRAIAVTNGMTLTWTAPVNQSGSSPATNYIIYISTNGYGFGNSISVGNVLTYTITNIASDTDFYFRVVAANAAGQSFPAEVVGCRRSSLPNAPKVLIVNGFTRFDRTQNLLQSTGAENYKAPGNSGTIERVNPRSNNSFDYVVQHGQAVSADNMAFDSCLRAAVNSGTVKLTNYPVVIWAAGQELVNTIDSTAQGLLTTFLQSGRGLFVSGSEIAGNLGRASSPAASRAFLQNQLHATLASDAHTNSASYTVTAVAGTIFNGIASGTIDNGTRGIYWVKSPDVLTPSGAGASAALNYSGGLGGASAIQYDGSAGGGRVVYFGFPFETISVAARRISYMAEILEFLSAPPPAGSPAVTVPPASQTVNRFADVTFSVAATGQAPLYFQWRYNGTSMPGETSHTLTLLNVQTNQAGQYSVVVSNSINSTLSAPGTLTVVIPTVTQTFFSDSFDTDTSSNWTTNRTSTDTRVTFHYNYANDGIPSAPNSTGGTQRGVKFEANMVNSNAAAICISPTGQSFSGDYDLKFDMWINANGPFPEGGRGSSQHITTGMGTAGNRIQWGGTGSTADGTWFAVDGEGQAGVPGLSDFAAYIGIVSQPTNSGVYAAGTAGNARASSHSYYGSAFPAGQTAPASQISAHPNQTGSLASGAVGFKWRQVLVRKTGNKVDWFIDSVRIASITNGVFNGNNIFAGYWDAFNSVSDNNAVSFGLVDNLRVERTTDAVLPSISTHPQDTTIVQGSNTTFTVAAAGTPNLLYQWRFSEVNIPGATATSYTVTNAQPAAEGFYSVMVSNIAGKVISSNATLSVIVPPSILTQPQGKNAHPGENVQLDVEATGSEPLSYQWFFENTTMIGQTFNSLIFTNAQPANQGNYFVIVTNGAGAITSDIVSLTINVPSVVRFDSAILSEGQLQLLLNGPPGSSYTIQVSSNLIQWDDFTNIVFEEEETAEFTEILSSTNSQRFYRAISP